ncbi:MAG: ABC transporter permease, partial [Clostridium sp.]
MIAIIKATILNVIRNRKNFMFLVFFPVFLTFLLGTVLSSYMDNEIEVGKIEVHYYDEGNENLKEAFTTFKEMDFAKDNNLELNFTEEKSIESGKNDVRVNKSIFVHLNEDKIDFYSNDSSLIQSSFVYGVLNNITKRYGAISEMYKINASKTTEILANNNTDDFLKEELIEEESSPRAIDYYGVAEIGLIIFYFVTCPIYYLKNERVSNIKERIIASGIS